MHLAVLRSQHQVLAVLLKSGASANSKSIVGDRPLDVAVLMRDKIAVAVSFSDQALADGRCISMVHRQTKTN